MITYYYIIIHPYRTFIKCVCVFMCNILYTHTAITVRKPFFDEW